MSERLRGLLESARRQKARRQAIAKDLPDSLASKYPDIYSKLKKNGELVKAGTRIRWGDKVMRASVDLWDTEQNTPDAAPSLWESLDFYKGYRIIPETITSTLAFKNGEVGYWPPRKKFYKAKREGVVHNPDVYAADWEEVSI
jgi:hypothetical protein